MSDVTNNVIPFRPRPKGEPEWQLVLNREALAYEVGRRISGSAKGEVVAPRPALAVPQFEPPEVA